MYKIGSLLTVVLGKKRKEMFVLIQRQTLKLIIIHMYLFQRRRILFTLHA
jgi:hypothetical protein